MEIQVGDIIEGKTRTVTITEIIQEGRLYRFIDTNGITGFKIIKKVK